MVSRATPEARYLYVSPASEQMVGWTPEELVGHNGHGFVHPEDLAQVTAALSAALVVPGVSTTKYRFRHKEGHYVWVESTARTLRDERGHVLEVQVATRDAAARPEVEEQLRRSESLHRTLTANLPDTSVFLLDRDLRVLVADGEGVRQLPWIDKNMFRGRMVTDLHGELPIEVLAMSLESYRGALEGERREFEFTADGLTFAVTAVPVRGMDGGVPGTLRSAW